jgi:hypothetical protein
MSLVWKLELRNGKTIRVNDAWPDADAKSKVPPINAILFVPETREISGYDEDGDPITTRFAAHYIVTVLPGGKDQPEPPDTAPMPVIRVHADDVILAHEVHSWAEMKDIVAETLGLNEDEDEGEDEEPVLAVGSGPAAASQLQPAAQPRS